MNFYSRSFSSFVAWNRGGRFVLRRSTLPYTLKAARQNYIPNFLGKNISRFKNESFSRTSVIFGLNSF
jgi:hypothetical protein